MRRATLVLLLGGVLIVGACRDDEDGADTSAASTTGSAADPIVIQTKMTIAAMEGAETIATGEVLDGSTVGDSPFCVGGTILDIHADPAEEPDALIARTITCPDGTLRMGLTPEVGAAQDPQDMTQKGSWTVISGTGAFEGLGGTGEMETTYGPDEDSPVHEALTGTVTHERASPS